MARKRMLRLYFMAAVSAMLLAGSGVTYASASANVHNTFRTGAVNIKLDEYHADEDGTMDAYDDIYGSNALPGQQISKIVRITNLAESCYVRTRIICRSDDRSWDLDISDIKGISSDWLYMPDGNFYLRKPLQSGGSEDLFTGVVIPQDIPQETMEGKHFSITVEADAIQDKNFTPDYESNSPWGDVKILKYTGSDDYSIAEVTSAEKTFRLSFDDGAGSIAVNGDDLFSNIPALMPGDEYSDTLELENNGKKAQTLMFRADDPSENTLSEKVWLTISLKKGKTDKQVYSGPANLNTMDEIPLAELAGGEKAELLFTVSIPAGTDNSAALQDGYVNWHFTVSPGKETEEKGKKKTAAKGSASGGVSSSGEKKMEMVKAVKTGVEDNMPEVLFIAGMGAALLTIGMAIKDHEKKEGKGDGKA